MPIIATTSRLVPVSSHIFQLVFSKLFYPYVCSCFFLYAKRITTLNLLFSNVSQFYFRSDSISPYAINVYRWQLSFVAAYLYCYLQLHPIQLSFSPLHRLYFLFNVCNSLLHHCMWNVVEIYEELYSICVCMFV